MFLFVPRGLRMFFSSSKLFTLWESLSPLESLASGPCLLGSHRQSSAGWSLPAFVEGCSLGREPFRRLLDRVLNPQCLALPDIPIEGLQKGD